MPTLKTRKRKAQDRILHGRKAKASRKIPCSLHHTQSGSKTTKLRESSTRPQSGGELSSLAARLLRLQDEERRRIARDLHDVTGQKIAFQSILLSQLSRTAADPEQRRLIEQSQALTAQISAEIRDLSYLLHPPLLDELGLASAIHWYVEGFRARTRLDVHLESASDFPRLLPEAEMALFRVAQESLANVHRYSGSDAALVKLLAGEGQAMLEVRDFGRGISFLGESSSETELDVVGILAMRERLRDLSGQLQIIAHKGEGTRILAIVPVSSNAIG